MSTTFPEYEVLEVQYDLVEGNSHLQQLCEVPSTNPFIEYMLKFDPTSATVKPLAESEVCTYMIQKEQFQEWFGGLSMGETLQQACDRVFGETYVTASNVQLQNIERYLSYMKQSYVHGRYIDMEQDVNMDKRSRTEDPTTVDGLQTYMRTVKQKRK